MTHSELIAKKSKELAEIKAQIAFSLKSTPEQDVDTISLLQNYLKMVEGEEALYQTACDNYIKTITKLKKEYEPEKPMEELTHE